MKRTGIIALSICALAIFTSRSESFDLVKTLAGHTSAKSIVHSGNGLFFAQNMMYRHTITVYNRNYELVKILPDEISLSDYGFETYRGVKIAGKYKGSPVECAFSHDGKFAWVSNYVMYGRGFHRMGHDKGGPTGNYDTSTLYKINTSTLKIENVVMVGSVPKFLAVSPDNRYVLVSNWVSWDLSVVDTATNREIRRIKIGPYPRGAVVNSTSTKAYIAVMGSYRIAVVDLKDFSVRYMENIGRSPRHLNLSPDGKFLYATLNGEGKVAKIDLATESVVKKINTGQQPRSMTISGDGNYLYVVNYKSNSVSKVRTSDMTVMKTLPAKSKPIGITYDNLKKEVWVSCYSGYVLVYKD